MSFDYINKRINGRRFKTHNEPKNIEIIEEKINKKTVEANKKKLIEQFYNIEKLQPRKYEDLTIYEKLYLSAVTREGLDESMTLIKPIKSFERELSPSHKHSTSIIKLLINANIIYPHPSSSISAFEDREDFPNIYNIYDAKYHINLISEKYDRKNLLEKVLYSDIKDINAIIDMYFNIWTEIVLEECKEYLIYSIEAVGFNFNIEDKTIKIKFKANLNDEPKKILPVQNQYIPSNLIESINVYRRSVMIEVNSPNNEQLVKQQILAQYENEGKLNRISYIVVPVDEDKKFKHIIMFDSIIHFSREPILKMGNLSIPLYKN